MPSVRRASAELIRSGILPRMLGLIALIGLWGFPIFSVFSESLWATEFIKSYTELVRLYYEGMSQALEAWFSGGPFYGKAFSEFFRALLHFIPIVGMSFLGLWALLAKSPTTERTSIAGILGIVLWLAQIFSAAAVVGDPSLWEQHPAETEFRLFITLITSMDSGGYLLPAAFVSLALLWPISLKTCPIQQRTTTDIEPKKTTATTKFLLAILLALLIIAGVALYTSI